MRFKDYYILEKESPNIIINEDEDGYIAKAILNNEVIGSAIIKRMGYLDDIYSYEFEDFFTEEEIGNIFNYDDEIISIEHLKVDKSFMGMGIGSLLMGRVMQFLKDEGFKQFYINASPMGFDGLNLRSLVNFYKKFGFKEILDQGNNVQMGLSL